MRKLSEIKDEDCLVIESLNDDTVVMNKNKFMQSHWYLDKKTAKVSLLAKKNVFSF